MDGFVLDRELGDWDLQAIVKGCKNNGDKIIADLKNKTEENCKRRGNEALEHLNAVDSGPNQRICDHAMEKGNSNKEIYKSRRRKNNYEIKVVQQVAENLVLSDKWNWRKYGQKTIKGSPYPRNYYKCSSASSGGCKARKQVEHNNTNPETLLIAYIHEHNHPYPTRRHSQAGRTKERFHPSPKLGFTMNELSSSNTPSSESSSFGGDGCVLGNLERNIINEGCLEDIGGRGGVVDVRNRVWDDEFLGGFEGIQMDMLWDGFSFDSFSSN